VGDLWQRRAVAYDDLQWVHDGDLLTWCVRQLGGHSPCPGARVVEVGCGTGALTERLGLGLADGTWSEVVAVDWSSEMVTRAARRAGPGVAVVCSDYRHLDTWVWGFDVLVARMVLHHSEEPVADTLRAWARLLRPGGVLAVFEGVPPTDDPDHDAYRLFSDAMAVKEPGRHVLTVPDLLDAMREAVGDDVSACVTHTTGNSLANWIGNNVLPADVRDRLWDLHADASPEAREAYGYEVVPGDVLMRWRHAAVFGRLPAG